MPRWIRIAAWSGLLGSLVCLAIGCGPNVESHTQNKTRSTAIANPVSTSLGKSTAGISKDHPDESGFLLLDHGAAALSWRLGLADAAEQTIDAQYFLWKNDTVGKVFMQRLLAAAKRGIRVRVLVDDSMTDSDPEYLAKFASHPNVELRLYKPFGPKRKSTVYRWLDYAADLKILNKRMHNKLFVVDGSVAVVGGRNIGNEYFDYPGPFVFRCRDLLAIGPVVEQTNSAFDLYWNSDWTVPIEQVVSPIPSRKAAEVFWKQLRNLAEDNQSYPAGFFDNPLDLDSELKSLKSELLWGKAKLLVDAVPTIDGRPQSHAALRQTSVVLGKMVEQTQSDLEVETAYLILLEEGFEALKRARDRGVNVVMATNSMASNNHVSAFVGYWKQRDRLLASGAKLFEMRPDAASERALFTPAQLNKYKTVFGLHCKTVVFDRRYVFVGSFNLDPRSVNLNCEMGFLIDSPELARAVGASIEQDISPGNSWQVMLGGNGEVMWVTKKDGKVTVETGAEPMASEKRRAAAKLLLVVPDDSQL